MQEPAHPRTPTSSGPDPRRILVRGVNWLGDAVMSTPALARLRERFPQTHIALLTPLKLEAFWRLCPSLSEVIGTPPAQNIFSVSRRLKNAGFDLGVVFPNSHRSALELWLARIPRRIGYARAWRNGLLTDVIRPRPDALAMHKRTRAEIRRLVRASDKAAPNVRPFPTPNAAAHQVHEYLHLVAAAFGANAEPLPPEIRVPANEVEAARARFSLPSTSTPVFGLSPGAEYGPAKRWPEDRFVTAARELHNRTHCLWIILGSRGDMDIARRIESALGLPSSALRNLAGQTTLPELCRLLKFCRVLLTNDTGTMHLAAAVGTPVVVPFGSTSPELTGPGLPGHFNGRLLRAGVPCSPCFLRRCPIDFRCMTRISPDSVVDAVLRAAGFGPPLPSDGRGPG